MEQRNIAVNLNEYTIYYVPSHKCYIAVDRMEWDKITALMNGTRLDHVSADEKTRGKILSYDEATKTYSITSYHVSEYAIKDLEVTVIQQSFGVIQ